MNALDTRKKAAVVAALGAAVALIALIAVSIAAGGDVADHSAGWGRVNEAVTAIAFLAGAACLALLVPSAAWRWWCLGIAGLAASGATMLFVVATGVEPPIWVFWTEVVCAFVGLVMIAASAIRRRVLPWWGAAGLGALLPIMFLVPFNAVPMALVWVLVAVGAVHAGRRSLRAAEESSVAMLPS